MLLLLSHCQFVPNKVTKTEDLICSVVFKINSAHVPEEFSWFIYDLFSLSGLIFCTNASDIFRRGHTSRAEQCKGHFKLDDTDFMLITQLRDNRFKLTDPHLSLL